MAIGHVAPGTVVPYTNTGGVAIAANTVIEFAAMIGITTGIIAPGETGTVARQQAVAEEIHGVDRALGGTCGRIRRAVSSRVSRTSSASPSMASWIRALKSRSICSS